MPKEGPIIIIEDDKDDQMLLKNALRNAEVFNPLIFFTDGPEAYHFLKTTNQQPFLIFCDVNLPRQNGIEFKTQLDNDPELRAKPVPFIFYTTYVSQYAINEAYKNLTVQGFFQKQNNYQDFNNVVRTIVQYWSLCRQPVSEISRENKSQDYITLAKKHKDSFFDPALKGKHEPPFLD